MNQKPGHIPVSLPSPACVGTKLVSTLGLIAFTLILLPWFPIPIQHWSLGVLTSLTVLPGLLGLLPLKKMILRSALVLPFSAFILVVNLAGDRLNMEDMMLIIWRAWIAIILLIALMSTTPLHHILEQLSKWGWPKLLLLILAFMMRYFQLFQEEARALERSMQLRHTGLTGWRRIRLYTNMIGMLFIRSFDRAARVEHAMALRGFNRDHL